MFMFENQITIGSRAVLEEYLNSFEYKTSGLSFTSLYMWRNINFFSWQIIGDYLCIAGLSHLELEKKEAFLFPPLTKTGQYEPAKLRETILAARKIFEENGQRFNIRLLPLHMIEIIEAAFPGELRFIEDRPNYDYVYLTRDLIQLAGRQYHSKKNHLNYFRENYSYEYKSLTSSMAEEAMTFIREFNLRKQLPDHEMDLLRMEEIAMEDVFYNLERVGYLTGALVIDGRLQALSIGGALGRKTVTVHVEKANVEYRGAYQAINNEFCRHMASHVKYINREEDMGIPGLRKAKLSYKPIKLIENHIAVFR
ncbi:MAG: DUF2156 domain-containing protein [Clostridiales bacterium]|nr:DUF2156 domain-containing protein [Clostridiales bacterium]